jgi:hypothetical protein
MRKYPIDKHLYYSSGSQKIGSGAVALMPANWQSSAKRSALNRLLNQTL